MSDFFLSGWHAFWIFLPAGVANMAPPIANKIPVLNRWQTPLDFGAHYKNERVLGDNKTWRGVTVGVVAASLTCMVEILIANGSTSTTSTVVISLIAGACLGFGALLGDAVESFIKRRVGVKPGQSWFPFDQLDYIIGGLVFFLPFVRLPLSVILWIFGLYFGLHLLVSYIGYRLGFKNQPI